jgi:hypothetical protein
LALPSRSSVLVLPGDEAGTFWTFFGNALNFELRRHRAIALDAEAAEIIITNASSKEIED